MDATDSSDLAAARALMSWHSTRWRPSLLWRYRVWMTGHAPAIFGGRLGASGGNAPDMVHIRAAATWLAAAQDATPDGGVVGRYLLRSGWTSSYPETTGYIVPTFLTLAEVLDPSYMARAERAVAFLLSTQLPNGAFPGSEIAKNSTHPSPFNTAQIIHGLLRWHQHTAESAALEAARRAGDWLADVQDADGAWRVGSYHDTAGAYGAHLSCWLADLGTYCGDPRLVASAARHVDWVVHHRDRATDWIDRCGFTEAEHRHRVANLHTIAYTLAGLLHSGVVLKRQDAIDAAAATAGRVAAVAGELGWLPGAFNYQWRRCVDTICLTGNAQMALVWMRLYEATGDASWLPAAWTALRAVKRAHILRSSNPGLHGGVAGAAPLWGAYKEGTMLSWSAKFLIDALLHKRAIEARHATHA